MKTFECTKCGSKDLFTKENGKSTGLYCSDCGKWIKWLTKEELRIIEHNNSVLKNERKRTMKTSELFEKELGFIQNDLLRKITAETLDQSPECIQTIPASSSGRYHPSADLGEGGLVRHIRAVTGIARTCMDSNVFRDIALGSGADDVETIQIYQDVAIAACILHDCCKPDDSPKHSTKFDHPLAAANLFKNVAAKYVNNENMTYMKVVIPLVHSCISSHMGRWNTAPYAKGIILPEPKLGIEVFVHLCDYIASRKFIDFNFEKYDSK